MTVEVAALPWLSDEVGRITFSLYLNMVPGINFEAAKSFALLPKLPRASHSSHACVGE
jgi:hypothetical protein